MSALRVRNAWRVVVCIGIALGEDLIEPPIIHVCVHMHGFCTQIMFEHNLAWT